MGLDPHCAGGQDTKVSSTRSARITFTGATNRQDSVAPHSFRSTSPAAEEGNVDKDCNQTAPGNLGRWKDGQLN